MRLPAVDAAAGGHAHDDRRRKVARRAIAQTCGLRHQLVVGRIKVIGELNFGHRPQAVCAHADRDADDAAFGDRRVEDA